VPDGTLKDQSTGTPVEIWFQDEMRVGQKNGLVYQWAKKGTRPRQPKDQRYANAYVFGAVCPDRDTGAAVVMPRANTEAMQKHLDEISLNVATGAKAVLILDKAGWHTTGKLKVPANITLLFLPPVSPELNPTENIWQYLRQTYLSNRVFESYEAIRDICCQVWRKLTNENGRIRTIATRSWATIGQQP
jgi:transposase